LTTPGCKIITVKYNISQYDYSPLCLLVELDDRHELADHQNTWIVILIWVVSGLSALANEAIEMELATGFLKEDVLWLRRKQQKEK
jgi:hypothetical protein